MGGILTPAGLGIALVLGMTTEVSAQQTLTVEGAVAEAQRNNLSVRDARLRLGIKDRDAAWSWNKFFPTLTVGTAWTRLSDTYTYKQLVAFVPSGPAAGNHYSTPDPANWAFQVTGQWAFSWALAEGVRQTGIDRDNAKTSLRSVLNRTERDVRKAYYQNLVLQEALKVYQAQLSAAETRYQQALANQKAGQSARLTVLQAKVAWDNKKPGVEDLKSTAAQALFGLEALLGRTPDPEVVLESSLDFEAPPGPLDGQELADRFLGRRLEVQAALGQAAAVAGLERQLWASGLPAVGVQYSADPFLNGPQTKTWDQITTGDNWHQKNGAWTWFVTWKLDNLLPLSGWMNQAFDLGDGRAQAEVGVEGASLAGRNEVLSLVEKINKSQAALVHLAENAAAAQEAAQLTQSAYEAGVRSLLEVQDSDVQLQFAQLAWLNERQVLQLALLDLEAALDTPRAELFAAGLRRNP